MGSLAQLASDLGFRVSGSDGEIYPPMSDLLADSNIEVFDHFDPKQLSPAPDQIVIGNAGQARGNPAIEYILDQQLAYLSGAEWLGTNILRNRWVIAVAGTHGKTTTASMLAWILSSNSLEPGFLIGGAPSNFTNSARLGKNPFFIVEADEYDTSYFDRRSKFVHYRPKTLIMNNLEYDHADIFPTITAIQDQFHLLVRSLPSNGLIIAPAEDKNLEEVLGMGCWTPIQKIQVDRSVNAIEPKNEAPIWFSEGDNSDFAVFKNKKEEGTVAWDLLGAHNRSNAMSAIAAAHHAGVPVAGACAALCEFKGVKRRLEIIYQSHNLTVYDDFAHHPSAIKKTLEGVRSHAPNDRIVAVIEPRTHTMSLGTLQADLISCTAAANQTYWFKGDNISWDLSKLVQQSESPGEVISDMNRLIDQLKPEASSTQRTHLILMSNGEFEGVHKKLLAVLQPKL